MGDIVYIILAVVLLIILIIIAEYNKMIRLQNKVKQYASGIDISLNKRFDLIPNLVECIKSYTKYEGETLENIIEKRNHYNQTKGLNVKEANEINNDLNKLIAVAENYPDLKANTQYMSLNEKLSSIEDEIEVARKIYNSCVTDYNTKIETVPSNLISGIFGFKKARLFEIAEKKKDDFTINM